MPCLALKVFANFSKGDAALFAGDPLLIFPVCASQGGESYFPTSEVTVGITKYLSRKPTLRTSFPTVWSCSADSQPFFRTCRAQEQAASKRNTGRRGSSQSQRHEYLRSASGSGVTEVIWGSNEKGLVFVRGLKD